MRAAVGLADGLGLDGDQCICVIARQQAEERTNQFQSIINLFIYIIFWDSDILQKCVMDLRKNRYRDEVKFVKKFSKVFGGF